VRGFLAAAESGICRLCEPSAGSDRSNLANNTSAPYYRICKYRIIRGDAAGTFRAEQVLGIFDRFRPQPQRTLLVRM
jgi:hypothetical protein